MLLQNQISQVKLMNESITPSQANSLLNALIDSYINFYKVQYMSNWERNHETSQHTFDQKVAELQQRRHELKAMLIEARETGASIEVENLLELKLVG